MVADHDGGGADEGGVDGGEEVVTADEGVAAGEARSSLAGGAAEEDVVEVREGLRGAEAARGGEDEGEVGAVNTKLRIEKSINYIDRLTLLASRPPGGASCFLYRDR